MHLYNDEKYYGKLGVFTGYQDFHIGDVLEVKDKANDNVGRVMVVWDTERDRFSALGLLHWDIINIGNDYIFKKVISWEDVSEDNINEITYTDGYILKGEKSL